jgi:protein gp37
MKVEWALDVMAQCKEAGVPFFMKQMEIDGKVTDDMSRFPIGLQVREWPK